MARCTRKARRKRATRMMRMVRKLLAPWTPSFLRLGNAKSRTISEIEAKTMKTSRMDHAHSRAVKSRWQPSAKTRRSSSTANATEKACWMSRKTSSSSSWRCDARYCVCTAMIKELAMTVPSQKNSNVGLLTRLCTRDFGRRLTLDFVARLDLMGVRHSSSRKRAASFLAETSWAFFNSMVELAEKIDDDLCCLQGIIPGKCRWFHRWLRVCVVSFGETTVVETWLPRPSVTSALVMVGTEAAGMDTRTGGWACNSSCSLLTSVMT
mmetsp:Transcript_61787/g.143762  ORF Transcript_61787/g.143762 Transcript_61787/m.143762 type:complete len:266 (+) Transcript_61787:1162-1959(+)